MTKIIPAHVLTMSVQVPEWVPTHVTRTESEVFARNRQRLLDEGHGYCLGCWLGGIHNGEDLQLHHGIVEWVTNGEANPNAALRAAKWLDCYGYAATMGDASWTDADDIRGLWFLCQDCHTGQPGIQHRKNEHWLSGGIHYAPFPIWLADRIASGVEERADRDSPSPTSQDV